MSIKTFIQCLAAAVVLTLAGCQSSPSTYTSTSADCPTGQCATGSHSSGGTVCGTTTVRAR